MKTAKRNTQEKRRQESRYSYDEYRKTFFPKPPLEREIQEPNIFGARLAEEALKQLDAKQSE